MRPCLLHVTWSYFLFTAQWKFELFFLFCFLSTLLLLLLAIGSRAGWSPDYILSVVLDAPYKDRGGSAPWCAVSFLPGIEWSLRQRPLQAEAISPLGVCGPLMVAFPEPQSSVPSHASWATVSLCVHIVRVVTHLNRHTGTAIIQSTHSKKDQALNRRANPTKDPEKVFVCGRIRFCWNFLFCSFFFYLFLFCLFSLF